jgi:hypothetical protein
MKRLTAAAKAGAQNKSRYRSAKALRHPKSGARFSFISNL